MNKVATLSKKAQAKKILKSKKKAVSPWSRIALEQQKIIHAKQGT